MRSEATAAARWTVWSCCCQRSRASVVRVLIAPGAPDGEAAERKDEQPGYARQAVDLQRVSGEQARPEVEAKVCEDDERPAVKGPLSPRGPERDLPSPLAPEEKESERDREEEGDLDQGGDDHQCRVELKDHHHADDRDDDREGAKGAVLVFAAQSHARPTCV